MPDLPRCYISAVGSRDTRLPEIEGSRINRLSFRKHDQPLTLSHQG
jgi:hypothetical protein